MYSELFDGQVRVHHIMSNTAGGLLTIEQMAKIIHRTQKLVECGVFHAHSVWLFTRSDLKTIVVPQSTFGILNAIANSEDWPKVSPRVPLVFFWVWLNLLPFAIDNQRQPAAILEDRYNKPWRTMPSERMTQRQAKSLMLFLYPVALVMSLWLGGTRQCLALMVLGYGYNGLNLADWSWVSRNAINACGFCCFASGALEVAIGSPLSFSGGQSIVQWLAMIGGIVFSTVQTQDMADQVGDSMRGRKSMPLALGDGLARWAIAIPMVGWSTICSWFWGVTAVVHVAIVCLGLSIACRTLAWRNVEADKRTFQLWNLWMACLYALPFLSASEL
ncbi:UbiA prenyltransferase family-domain-containing protein [Triangularia verruculosa]|uniref:UbiA prenyltransferase family-domain-containing protein n=1 Tax=Triangularia verruculosa TaxID=2587418 RepID=A0AAN7ATB9_9PEZI|nr:UbiA prenyltransferase family-domain-containing protein [Triangularia verruculosa]